LKKLMMLAAMLAVALVAAAPIAMAQSSDPQVVADAKAKTATAGGPSGANAEADCTDGMIESKAGGVVAKAPCEQAPPPPKAAPTPPPPKAAPAPPPPKAAPAPPPPKAAPAPAPAPKAKAELPKSGGAGTASLISLGAGALLVSAGLVARRIIK
jgi:LPXTG-motif cell wall-anchored protein